MTTREQFNNMPFESRCGFVNEYGRSIEIVHVGKFRVALYELEKNLVAVWYDSGKERVVEIVMPTFRDFEILVEHVRLPGYWTYRGFIFNTNKN